MKKVLAISGGVDSVVLLHAFSDDKDAVVAHFNHGTRPSATEDENFVRTLAEKYGFECFVGRAALGKNASEAEARISRYEYFKNLAKSLDGQIFTAHHQNDLIESIAINLVRGTGWRGLTPFGDASICRPFIETECLPANFKREIAKFSDFDMIDKSAILKYAAAHNLSFRQDPTNTEDQYLRNRLRLKLMSLEKSQILSLTKIYYETNNLKTNVDDILGAILPENGVFERAWFNNLDDTVAIEILRVALLRANVSATRPQLLDFLNAIRTYAPGKKFNLPNDKLVKFTKTSFSLS